MCFFGFYYYLCISLHPKSIKCCVFHKSQINNNLSVKHSIIRYYGKGIANTERYWQEKAHISRRKYLQ